MPGTLSGINVLRILRQEAGFREIHVVIVSALHPHELQKSDVLLADAYITKPFSKQHLIDWYEQYKTGVVEHTS